MHYDELLPIYAEGPEAVFTLVNGLEERIRELEAGRNLSSRNSSKPPSSDGLCKPAPKSQRKRSGRRVGGQRGHPGTTLQPVENPDHVVLHPVEACPGCGRSLRRTAAIDSERRQVIDLPPIRPEVTEHRAEIKASRCGEISNGTFPEGVSSPVQYGPRIKATAVYLSVYQLLPFQRAGELFRDLFSLSLSPGTLARVNECCYERLASAEDAVRQQLMGSPVVHFDESGLYSQGKRHWLHVASTGRLTLYHADARRGVEAMEVMGVLPGFQGTAVHDHWKPYYRYRGCLHSLCNAHHLRELTYVHEQLGQRWAEEMKQCLRAMKKAADEAARRGTALAPRRRRKLERGYDSILRKGLRANPPPKPDPRRRRGRPKQSKPKNLLDRLKEYKRDVLRFLNDAAVPFDNNTGERDIRMAKLKQKISGTFRGPRGAKIFARTRGYISTARKNGVNPLDAIRDALEGKPFIPGKTTID